MVTYVTQNYATFHGVMVIVINENIVYKGGTILCYSCGPGNTG